MCTTTYKRNSIQEVEVHEPCIKSHRGNHQPYLIYIYIYNYISFPQFYHLELIKTICPGGSGTWGHAPLGSWRCHGLPRRATGWSSCASWARPVADVSWGKKAPKRHQKNEAWWKSDDITILGGFYMVLLCSSIRFYVHLCSMFWLIGFLEGCYKL